MRIANWNPGVLGEMKGIAYDRLVRAAFVVKDRVAPKLRSEIGTGKTTGISRPVYKRGPYAGQRWTGREFGRLLKSVRVVEKYNAQSEKGRMTSDFQNVRVYAGNYFAYYADIFEATNPFMKPAFYSALPEVKNIMGTE